MTVTGYPEISTAGLLNIGNVFINTKDIYQVIVENTGTDTLFIDSMSLSNNIFVRVNSLSYILAAKKDSFAISFEPPDNILYTGSLIIYSNALAKPVWTVNIEGKGIKPQSISVIPALFNQTLCRHSQTIYPVSYKQR